MPKRTAGLGKKAPQKTMAAARRRPGARSIPIRADRYRSDRVAAHTGRSRFRRLRASVAGRRELWLPIAAGSSGPDPSVQRLRLRAARAAFALARRLRARTA